jgi:hypothetical protein
MIGTLPLPFSCLVSFHFFQEERGKDIVRNLGRSGAFVVGDSGAFSALTQGATIDIEVYAAWLAEMSEYLVWAASLDVIGNVEASWQNWKRLTAMGQRVVPTVHFTAPTSALDRYADAGATLVGLGGLVNGRDLQGQMRWLISIFRHARDHHPQLRFHGWGVSSGRRLLDHLPFFSVDSSGFGAAYRYGRASLFDVNTGINRMVPLDGYSAGAHGRWLRAEYGVEPRDIARSYGGNRDVVRYLMFQSAQRMERHYQDRHQVTPPAGLERMGNGTHIHFADASDNVMRHLAECLEAGKLVPDLPGVRRG